MFGLGFWEIAIILGVALLVLGPSKLPELARGLGKGLREFRKATEDFKSTIDDEAYRPDPPKPMKTALPEQAHVELPPPPIIATADPIKQMDPIKQAELPTEPKSPTES
jgi:TatA/E family protein of Tat protein translocase